jgi:anti-anti-sigma regulatory factor
MLSRLEFKSVGSVVLIEAFGERMIGGGVVVTEDGRELPAYEFRAHFRNYLAHPHPRFVIDLSRVVIDSAVVGDIMLAMYKRTRDVGGWIGFVVNSKGEKLLTLTKLDSVFMIFERQHDALTHAETWKHDADQEE